MLLDNMDIFKIHFQKHYAADAKINRKWQLVRYKKQYTTLFLSKHDTISYTYL